VLLNPVEILARSGKIAALISGYYDINLGGTDPL